MQNIRLEPFEKRHLEKACEIYCKAYAEGPYFEKIDEKHAKLTIEDILLNNSSLCFAIEHKEELLGFILGFVQRGKRHYTFYIEEFVVDPRYQDRGIGNKALAELEKKLIEKGIFGITLLSHKKGALEFFRKNGFKETNWVLMWKRLEE